LPFEKPWPREKGGNGMKHHEAVIDFSRRGMVELFWRLIDRKTPPDPMSDHDQVDDDTPSRR
jgi:hypothetical protein